MDSAVSGNYFSGRNFFFLTSNADDRNGPWKVNKIGISVISGGEAAFISFFGQT